MTVSGTDDPGNVHAAWRLGEARRIAAAYPADGQPAVLAAAGSVGRGIADRFSDLELDCYWLEPPSDQARRAPIEALGGEVTAFWAYDAGDREWSEDYRLGPLDVTVSNFVTGTAEEFLTAVTQRADTDLVKHMRLAAIQAAQPLIGADLLADWRRRADQYPAELARTLAEQALSVSALPGWSAREALASRGDEIALHALLSGVERAVLGAVLASNRVYAPHRLAKWQRSLLAGLRVAPADLAVRLHGLWSLDPPGPALAQAEDLLAETADVAEAETGADLAEFRADLAERRRPVEPPSQA